MASQLSHLSAVVLDSGWEKDAALALETTKVVLRYVKNTHAVGFRVPWFKDGRRHWYEPDFIVHLNDGREDPLQVVVEVSGSHPDKPIKMQALRDLWLPSVNKHGGFGRWTAIEVTDLQALAAEEDPVKPESEDLYPADNQRNRLQ